MTLVGNSGGGGEGMFASETNRLDDYVKTSTAVEVLT